MGQGQGSLGPRDSGQRRIRPGEAQPAPLLRIVSVRPIESADRLRRRAGDSTPGEIVVTANALFQIALFLGVLIALTKPLGAYMACVYEHKRLPGLDAILGPIERLIYRIA